MKKQELFQQVEEQIIAEGEEGRQMKEQDQVQSMEDEQLDELMPQPAFHIEEDHEHLTQEERDAFSYILAVRNQKQSILKNKNISDHQDKNISDRQSIILSHQNKHIERQKQQIHKSSEHIFILEQWKAEVVQNWKCVVQNLKYLIKHSQPQAFFKSKISYQNLKQIPLAQKLCLNNYLTLSQIQKLLVTMSNMNLQQIQDSKSSCIKQNNFHIWLYSLLALHQAHAHYNNFEALGSVNASIEREAMHFQKILKITESNTKILNNDRLTGWLMNLFILIQVFKQYYLTKYLKIVELLPLPHQ